jgi:aminoglycoside N3'-acetyltransferase
LVQKTNTDGQEKEMTTKIKGDLARVDIGSEMSAILSAEGMTVLMHAQKSSCGWMRAL